MFAESLKINRLNKLMHDNTVSATIVVSAALVIATLIYSTSTYYRNIAEQAIKAGLVEGAVEGQQGVHWIKPKN